MKISCTICTELMGMNEDLLVTKCGHLFHSSCLTDWLQRSHSCPQCRCMTKNFTFQVYPTISDETSDMEALQSNLDEALQKVQDLHVASGEKDNQMRIVTENLMKNEEILKVYASEFDSVNSIVGILKEELDTMVILKEQLEKENCVANEKTQRLKIELQQSQEKIRSLKKENQHLQELIRVNEIKLEEETHCMKEENQLLKESLRVNAVKMEEDKNMKVKIKRLLAVKNLLKEQTADENLCSKQMLDKLDAGIHRLEKEMQRLKDGMKNVVEENQLLEGIRHSKDDTQHLEGKKQDTQILEVEEVSSFEDCNGLNRLETLHSYIRCLKEKVQNVTNVKQDGCICHQEDSILKNEMECLTVENKSSTEEHLMDGKGELNAEPLRSIEKQRSEGEGKSVHDETPFIEEIQLSEEECCTMDIGLEVEVNSLKDETQNEQQKELSEEKTRCLEDDIQMTLKVTPPKAEELVETGMQYTINDTLSVEQTFASFLRIDIN